MQCDLVIEDVVNHLYDNPATKSLGERLENATAEGGLVQFEIGYLLGYCVGQKVSR